MNDFLTRLAQRSLGEPPAIQPRLPGLFGPLDEERASANEAAAFDVRDSSRPAAASSLALPVSWQASGGINMVDVVGASPSPIGGKGQVGEANESVFERKAPPQPTLVSGDDEHVPRNARTLPKASPGDRQRSRDDRPAGSVLLPLAPSASAPAEVPPRPHPLLAAELEGLNASEGPAGGTFATTLSQREPAQMPAVHITIGRVEVRANLPAPQPSPRPRPDHKPTLSLGDYLKRRGGRT